MEEMNLVMTFLFLFLKWSCHDKENSQIQTDSAPTFNNNHNNILLGMCAHPMHTIFTGYVSPKEIRTKVEPN